MAGDTTIEIRMYYVGFGDAFRVTVRKGDETFRMLVDCGVHSQGHARDMKESVRNIIDDLTADCGGTPRLDVVVATHHHTDHVSGFAVDFWEEVEVGEVWVPFIEDTTDPDAQSLLETQIKTAQKLKGLIDARRQRLAADDVHSSEMLDMAEAFVDNSRGKSRARNRLLSRNDATTFANKPKVQYLPSADPAKNVIDTGKCGVVAHVLGPPRDPELLKKMDPPKGAGWLTLNLDDVAGVDADHDSDDGDGGSPGDAADDSAGEEPADGKPYPLFNKDFVLDGPELELPEAGGARGATRPERAVERFRVARCRFHSGERRQQYEPVLRARRGRHPVAVSRRCSVRRLGARAKGPAVPGTHPQRGLLQGRSPRVLQRHADHFHRERVAG